MALHEYIDPPPSYAEATASSTRRHTAASTSSAALNPVYSRGGAPMFPRTFAVYTQSPRHYVLGESQSAPRYAVSTHSSLSSRPDVVIHSGVSQDTPPLATVDHEPFSRSASITLPARAGSRFPVAHEPLASVGPFTRLMSFSIETTPSGRGREHFEWRHSSGGEVEALGGRHSGWKLVRVSAPDKPQPHRRPALAAKKHHAGANANANANANALGTSSDGKEVVAVWAAANLSVSKALRFRFIGSGADGSLGDRWAAMAVASALAIWHRDRRSRSAGSATVSAGF
ncbi:hypothetical protein F5X98DRAFT_362962 [Xylaria grammica]|nr:hypothetical protein F5X98DRAFT_362962 [Xylaria grammica]